MTETERLIKGYALGWRRMHRRELGYFLGEYNTIHADRLKYFSELALYPIIPGVLLAGNITKKGSKQ